MLPIPTDPSFLRVVSAAIWYGLFRRCDFVTLKEKSEGRRMRYLRERRLKLNELSDALSTQTEPASLLGTRTT